MGFPPLVLDTLHTIQVRAARWRHLSYFNSFSSPALFLHMILLALSRPSLTNMFCRVGKSLTFTLRWFLTLLRTLSLSLRHTHSFPSFALLPISPSISPPFISLVFVFFSPFLCSPYSLPLPSFFSLTTYFSVHLYVWLSISHIPPSISLFRSPYTLLSSLFTFLPEQVAASLGPGSFGAYVISQATCASDVLAVMLLQVCAISQRQCTALVVYESCWKGLFNLQLFFGLFRGLRQFKLVSFLCSRNAVSLSFSLWILLHSFVPPPQKQFGLTSSNGKLLRVVPLFETLTDLNNAADVCETLFSLPGYLDSIKHKQEIMVRTCACRACCTDALTHMHGLLVDVLD